MSTVTVVHEDFYVDADGPTASRIFGVHGVESPYDAALAVKSEYNVDYYEAYENIYGDTLDANLRCYEIRVDPDAMAPVGGTGLYRLIARYRKFYDPDYRWRGRLISEPTDTDKDGNKIVNSAGEPFDPPLTWMARKGVLVITWTTEKTFTFLRGFEGRVNSIDWETTGNEEHPPETFAARCMLCKKMEIKPFGIRSEGTDGKRLAVAEFEYRDPQNIGGTVFGGHDSTILDRGFSHLESGSAVVNKDANGNRLSEPQFLDGAGNITTTPVVLSFLLQPEKDFNLLEV